MSETVYLLQKQIVLGREVNQDPDAGAIHFVPALAPPLDGPKEDDPSFFLPRLDWEEMGSPDEITVTVVPDDQLNE